MITGLDTKIRFFKRKNYNKRVVLPSLISLYYILARTTSTDNGDSKGDMFDINTAKGAGE
jgi:hypothetical protein